MTRPHPPAAMPSREPDASTDGTLRGAVMRTGTSETIR
jgi:hypothetical protein